MKPDRNRFHCEELTLRKDRSDVDGDIVTSIHWIKKHFSCNAFALEHVNSTNIDKELLEFLLTGSYWTSKFTITGYAFSRIIVALVQVKLLWLIDNYGLGL
ncbi:hypothetical protein DdX_20370 [Ditylenchus destructor]|uniref:Uncharacterized protein n=1 Tax=Ditylenchus destructor TaxID=166010 RepID=A0AAD4MHA5_9BILA|nr:hypothetical protein DdX_20370 [Ditylenchus destructor]